MVVVAGAHDQLAGAGRRAARDGHGVGGVDEAETEQVLPDAARQLPAQGVVGGDVPIILAERAERTAPGITARLFNTAKGVGGSISGAVFAAVLTSIAIAHTSVPRVSPYVVVWLVCGACALVSLLAIVTSTRRDREAAADAVANA